ncbi:MULTISPECIES: N-acetylmuramoyl-L-alanine amidase [Methylosinus]|uniref:N-acetylmuramoyl-L-alanine amidase n=1 Tax=Methylosinus trichosporium (strain ATCC 35070 / NCIMB 11131 / UNIQEM 75 / OB3b) TaxID=595536 RepID=A0A2D2D0R8_METT3|nr:MULTISPECIES: N-acetylmuramoyl-L-alanine amidase [Methylosinus]ATQ68544.1 N-acetylmuramoyl-L-alanine amidase [Methylosinus trichosporium OB3b]OBS52802.1 N-acetylmuramoyl-L-alanine amidase [Methylosinus sp. 3S-1]
MLSPDSPFAAELRLSPNQGERLRPVSSLILHYTGMPSAAGALRLLTSEEAQVSSHYFVDEDGTILQLVPEARRAWHAGRSFWAGEEDMNSASIGIEIVHPGHVDPHPFPDRQIEAVAQLCRDICARNAIAPRRVLGHSDIAIGRKIDPGEFFPWRALAECGVGHFVEPAPIVGGAALEPGAEGGEVSALQQALADYGYKSPVSGCYDEGAAAVVAAFQRHFRPRLVDGRADRSTLDTLRALSDAIGAAA